MKQIRKFPNHENNEDENEKMCNKFTNNTYTKKPPSILPLNILTSQLSVYLSKFAAIIYNPTTIELTVAVVAHNVHTMLLNIFHNFHICACVGATFITSSFSLSPKSNTILLSIFFRVSLQ